MRNFQKITSIRLYCTKPQRPVAKSIYFSKCTDIFTNLALEDWLYKNRDFTNHHLLMLWRNQPCVVVGRHQNPWLECNFASLPTMGVELARRNSGGGTVYHDIDNLNLTFFTGRSEYSRRRNLQLISSALKHSFDISSEINKREDLCINDHKISGTASKLGRLTAYHHCTLLVNSNKDNLSLALKNTLGNVKTNATVSVKSKIMNLSEIKLGMSVDEVMEAIVEEYGQNVQVIESIDEANYPGVTEIRNTFKSNQWKYEKTPKFTIYRDLFDIVEAFLVIEQGKIVNGGIETKDLSLNMESNNLRDLSGLFNEMMGKNFTKEVLDEFEMVVCELRHNEICKNIIVNR
ncbi:unnamed protein product [Ceutorhynchus assimilis]|uniref:BPL/LPL catalytic domain-containing protein n=1 Tax=Ceutorhynchus assimilis TaxID=467358 RepID=A0A9N9MZ26_9CUCU|nr:unnamed protein product [Ceutorhynchus assimilis]